jgi:hypothetical protein
MYGSELAIFAARMMGGPLLINGPSLHHAFGTFESRPCPHCGDKARHQIIVGLDVVQRLRRLTRRHPKSDPKLGRAYRARTDQTR